MYQRPPPPFNKLQGRETPPKDPLPNFLNLLFFFPPPTRDLAPSIPLEKDYPPSLDGFPTHTPQPPTRPIIFLLSNGCLDQSPFTNLPFKSTMWVCPHCFRTTQCPARVLLPIPHPLTDYYLSFPCTSQTLSFSGLPHVLLEKPRLPKRFPSNNPRSPLLPMSPEYEKPRPNLSGRIVFSSRSPSPYSPCPNSVRASFLLCLFFLWSLLK